MLIALLPGPPIIVYEGQTVVIRVNNNLQSESVSIHWHGVEMKDTPWMDGPAYITQCPISPGQKFTYMFSISYSIKINGWAELLSVSVYTPKFLHHVVGIRPVIMIPFKYLHYVFIHSHWW
jgi:hypothetical protein